MMHKLRSFLTILGLVFGVASVIVMLAVAEGASQTAQRQIASLGINNIIVRSVKPAVDAPINFRSFIQDFGLKYDDLRRIRETLDTVVRITPLREFVHEARYEDATIDARRLSKPRAADRRPCARLQRKNRAERQSHQRTAADAE